MIQSKYYVLTVKRKNNLVNNRQQKIERLKIKMIRRSIKPKRITKDSKESKVRSQKLKD